MHRILAAAALLLIASSAYAIPVTYDFTGVIDSTRVLGTPDVIIFPAGLDSNPIGHTLSGSITIEPDTPDATPANPDRGNYYYAVRRFTMQLDGLSFEYDALTAPEPLLGAVYAYQNTITSPPIHDFIAVDAPGAATDIFDPLNEGATLSLFHLAFDLDEITSDAMPADLTLMPDWTFYLTIGANRPEGDTSHFQLFAPVNLTRRTEVSVTEPAPLALLMLGLGVVYVTRRLAVPAAGARPGAAGRRHRR
jgi:hypothetical protein